MDRKEYRHNSETIASLLLPLKMHCNENTNKCIDETLRAWSKLEKIEQIVADYDGSTPSMIKQFSELQKILEQE